MVLSNIDVKARSIPVTEYSTPTTGAKERVVKEARLAQIQKEREAEERRPVLLPELILMRLLFGDYRVRLRGLQGKKGARDLPVAPRGHGSLDVLATRESQDRQRRRITHSGNQENNHSVQYYL